MTIEQLHAVEREQTAAALAKYWDRADQALKRRDDLPPKLAAELMSAARAVGKSASDVERDIDLLEELQTCESSERDLAAAVEARRDTLRAAVAKDDEAKRTLERGYQLAREAEALRHHAQHVTQQAQEAQQKLHDVRSQLAAAQHPRFAQQATDDGARRQIESLQNDLRILDLRIAEFTPQRFPNGLNRALASELGGHLRRRAELVASLESLGVEAPDEPDHVEAVWHQAGKEASGEQSAGIDVGHFALED